MPGMHMGEQRYRSLNLTSKWRWVASLILYPLYPWGKSPWYMLDGSLDVPQSMEVVWPPWVEKSKVQQNEYFKWKILILCSQQILNNRPKWKDIQQIILIFNFLGVAIVITCAVWLKS
jgi:hypothetical protein